MGNNVKKLTEKSLKAFLKKKKVGFTVALITAFMITGGLTLGSTAELQTQVEITHQELLDKIVSQKMEIEQMIKDNEDKLWKLKSEQMSRVREGDWYSKPWYPSYFGSLIGWYESSDNVGKDWKGSIRGDTRMDKTRLVFDEALYKVAGGYLSSGWINNTKAYDENTNVYDYEDKIIILPVVRVPELTKPVVPTVAITMPATPAKVNTPIASVPTISPIDVTIVTPSVVPPSAPGTINVVAPTLTPIVVNDPGINPVAPNIVVNPAEPVFSITPNTPGFSMAVKEVGEIPTITVVPPSVDPDLPVPNASPFTDFQFQPSSNADTSTTSQTNTGRILYSGYNPTNSPIGTVLSNTIGDVSIKYGINGRMPAVTYLANNSAGSLTGGTYYIAGGNAGTYNAKTGQIGIHIVWNATIKNVTGHLYGKAAFISVETWHGGKITLDNVTISTIKNQDNTIFYIYPAGYQAINTNHNAHNQRGEFSGTINATIQSNRNSIYVQSGISGSYKIESKGTYILEGFGNTVYSGLGYSPDYSKLSGVSPDGITYGQINGSVDMKPSLQFITAPESYGDENVIIFFNTKMNTASLPAIYNGTGTIATDIKPFIGFYQGQIFASAKIGEKLSTITSSTKQDYGNISGNSDVYVDSNVGIYSKSGQREEIATNADLGAPDRNPSTMADYKLDSIHNLEIGQIDIKFGKFSKNGVMIASENGTVIDIAKEAMGITSKAGIDQLPVVGTTTLKYSSWFSDGTDKIATTEANASINTIIAYASGAFSNTIHGLGTVIGTTLDGKGSEINIHIPLGMVSHGGDTSSEYAIAYFAKEGGIINQKSTTLFNDGTTLETATTVARGYKSIIAYADGTGSIVDVDGSIKAVDGNVSLASNKYQNIGAFASSGGEIVVTGKAEINGIGALADGNNSKVEMENTLNIVNSGLKGAVVAMNNGLIEFVGTINHGVPGAPGDYSEIVPFYADSTGKIDFTGTTTINMYKGILLEGTMVDYSNASSTSAEITAARYNDMQNVSVVLQASGVNLGVFDNFAATYDTEVSYLTSLALFAKLGSLTNAGTYTYDSFLIDGTLNVTTNGTISLDSNPFKNITMQNEVVTFS
ncbi:MAG: autotransporter-associated N-terminal domain-containing protein, partial [Fusobacteriaceae bacterium]|nr:autotransporter-associated N-terminal domain-containing protein [Fusobacteriaceae bacterium]